MAQKSKIPQRASDGRQDHSSKKRLSSSLPSPVTASTITESESNKIEIVSAAINSLRKECGQTNELIKLEEYYSSEVIDQLKQIMMPWKASFRINPATVSNDGSPISDAVLTSEGIVCLLNDRGKVILRRPLGEFQTEILLKIMEEILPEAQNLGKVKPSQRLSRIEKVSRQLRKMIYGESTGD